MRKAIALLFVIVLLVSSLVFIQEPVLASTAGENTWVSRAPMHEARRDLGVVAVDGKIYAIGGTTETWHSFTGLGENIGGVVGTNEEYDPITNAWIYKQPMPTPLANFAIAVCQNKIYCVDRSIMEVYDPATDIWETKESMPTARDGVQANVVNGKIYFIGGHTNPESYINYDYRSSLLHVNEVYDPATDSWSTKAPIPIGDAYYVSAVVDNNIYIIGSRETQIYNAVNDTWRHGPPLGSQHTVAVATTGLMAPKLIYALGITKNSDSILAGSVLADRNVHVYDPKTDTWTFGANIPSERVDFGAAVVDDKVYVVGGLLSASADMFSATYRNTAANDQYIPFGYGTIPPMLSLDSPTSGNYSLGEVSLNFTVSRAVNWSGYSLDGQENVTVSGNTTIAGLANGKHNITIYAKDEFGNVVSSETRFFDIEVPEPFSTVPIVATLSASSVAIICVGVFFYLRKRKHSFN